MFSDMKREIKEEVLDDTYGNDEESQSSPQCLNSPAGIQRDGTKTWLEGAEETHDTRYQDISHDGVIDNCTNRDALLPDDARAFPRSMSDEVAEQSGNEAVFFLNNARSCKVEDSDKSSDSSSSVPEDPLSLDFKCETCSLEFPSLVLLNQHISGWPPGQPICGEAWPPPEPADTGQDDGSDGRKEKRERHLCGACGAPFESIKLLQLHELSHDRDSTFSCALCDAAAFNSAEALRLHDRTKHSHFCGKCGAAFSSERALEIHEQLKHHDAEASKPIHKCNECGAAFAELGRLSVHQQVHAKNKFGACTQCHASFYTLKSLKRHQWEKHLICMTCEEEFDQLLDLRRSWRGVQDERPSCSTCGAEYWERCLRVSRELMHRGGLPCQRRSAAFAMHSELLRQNLVAAADGKKRYSCTSCDTSFEREWALVQHVQTTHSQDNKPFVCAACGEAFGHESVLRRHARSHEGRAEPAVVIRCEVCGDVFRNDDALRVHRNKRHNPERERKRQHVCATCGQAFIWLKHLRYHEKEHDEEPPPAVCDICGFTCDSKRGLYCHKTRKHPARPQVCPTCGAIFASKKQLFSHRRARHKTPCVCPTCGITCISRKALSLHKLRKHKWSFRCSVCAAGFNKQASLLLHEASHAEDEGSPKGGPLGEAEPAPAPPSPPPPPPPTAGAPGELSV